MDVPSAKFGFWKYAIAIATLSPTTTMHKKSPPHRIAPPLSTAVSKINRTAIYTQNDVDVCTYLSNFIFMCAKCCGEYNENNCTR